MEYTSGHSRDAFGKSDLVRRAGGILYDKRGNQRSEEAIAAKVREELAKHPDYWL
eukprot:COSAG05_NODE_344_length_11005_cov_35.313772_6_plen_55_part_00